ncbi:dual specificity protein phosphatase PHS1-like [Phragmites australis]|uniref:dual specificity protein phosphatase PHS1-like n=1 Tax=Phragmites australis TaxID=29695 RepID=UPI002D79F196|nr:dual specificity protein phosphatase PHS1-like [Phragmites australis]
MEERSTESGTFSRSSSFGGFEEWVALVRKRNGQPCSSGRLALRSSASSEGLEHEDPDNNVIDSNPCGQMSETSLWERLGRVSMMDIESSNFSWSSLTSLHHTKHTTTSTEPAEDDNNRSFEVTVNSGGVVFIALFRATENNDSPSKEAAAVIKIAPSRMATQSERFGYELAKWLRVRTPQGRVIHNSSTEWQKIKDAVENARHVAISAGDELEEMICTEMLEALELSRCLFLMNYVHGSPLLESAMPFDSRESAEALGRVLILDLVLRNEDRLRCRPLGWRGNYANLLVADKEAYSNLDSLDDVHDSAIIRYKPEIIRSPQKQQRRAASISGSISSDVSELMLEDSYDPSESGFSSFNIVAIDSGVPRRPPAGKRAKDQESYPRLVELTLNNLDYSSNLLFEVSFGKLGLPGPEAFDASSDYSYRSPLSESNMVATVNSFRGGFRSALRDLQRFHIFLLTLYQKLDGLLKIFFNLMYKGCNESDKEDAGPSDSPLCLVDAQTDSNDTDIPRHLRRPSRTLSRDSLDLSSPACRENFITKHFKGNGDASRGLRMTMKLRDFNKYAKVDSELSKEIEQWNDMFRTDVVKLCQDNNFNTGFFEGTDNSIAVDAYELKVRLEHILERISLISDAANTERPSQITDYLYIGGALAARSTYTLQHLGITHILCLCANEIGQSESQQPSLFDYRNFSIKDDDNADIGDVFQDASDFIDYVEHLCGKVLVHCFEGKSRSATVILAYLMMRKSCTLLEAWNMLKKVHRRAHPNDGFAKVLLDLDKKLHGKISMEWQHKRPAMKVCPICGKNAGLSSSSLKLHLQKAHRKISSGSVDSAMTLEIQKAIEAMKAGRGGSDSPTQKSQSHIEGF